VRKGASQRYFGSAIHSKGQRGSNGSAFVGQGRLFSEESYQLAGLTTRMRKPDECNHNASVRALNLLETCSELIEGGLTERAREEQERRTVPEHLTFNEGLKWITGQSRPERARKVYANAMSFIGLSEEDAKDFFARHADRDTVPTPRDDAERGDFRLACADGQFGGFTRHDLLLYRRFILWVRYAATSRKV